MIHFHFCSFYKFTIKPPEITLAGGYAFDVTPEKACWLFIPFLFEKNATFSAEMKNWVLDKLRRDTNDLAAPASVTDSTTKLLVKEQDDQ